ncbi:phosphomannomutase/phosphoglucomutase [Thermodesulfovibrionales bacterium]|nr:phosphomannomutase/phosphoglucomutase [Thermodesulfovibrionales bacterium]
MQNIINKHFPSPGGRGLGGEGAELLNEKIFREYDIRGIAGKDIDKDVAISVGKAFSSLLKKREPNARHVSVGRDVRLTSDELSEGIIEGIISTGINVYNIGICPTPLQYFSIFHLGLDGGIMVTGSHNPPEYNGFKITSGSNTIHSKGIQGLKETILQQNWMLADKGGDVKDYDIIGAYRDYMLDEFSYLRGPEFKRLKVVIDAGNATAGIVAPEIVSSIGCDVIPIYCEPDGRFPNHHPDPTVVENMQDLITETINCRADIGVGYDGDADRLGVVGRDGNIVWGDQLMVILAREILRENNGAKVIGDVKCSQTMFDDIKRHGGNPIMWKTGHSLIKQKMKEEGALIAGELSGHIFIKDRYFGYDDAIYATLRLVEIMKKRGRCVRELLSDLPETFYTPEIRIDRTEDDNKAVVEKVVERFIGYKNKMTSPHKILDLNTIDGVRVTFKNGWGLIRASNTQPVIVMRVEAKDQEGLYQYKSFIEDEIMNAKERYL